MAIFTLARSLRRCLEDWARKNVNPAATCGQRPIRLYSTNIGPRRVVNIELQYPHFIESWVERRSFNLFSFIHEAKIFDDFAGAGREARDYREAIVGDIAPPIHDLLPNTIKIMLLT